MILTMGVVNILAPFAETAAQVSETSSDVGCRLTVRFP